MEVKTEVVLEMDVEKEVKVENAYAVVVSKVI